MKMMAIEMTIFAVAIGWATFVESDYGTPASKIAVYNSTWFAILLFHLFIILIVNIINYKMYRKEKWPTFLFHIAFLIIIIGAGITRYIGFEGQIRIGVGETSDVMYTTTPYLIIKANDQVNQFTYDEKEWQSEGVENPFSFSFQLPNQKKINVDYVSYKEDLVDSLVESDNGRNALNLVIQGQDKFVFQGQQGMLGGVNFSFDSKKETRPGIRVTDKNGKLYIRSAAPFEIVDMTSLSKEDRMSGDIDSSAISLIPADTLVPFQTFKLYKIGKESVMFKAYRKNVEKKKVKASTKGEGENYLTIQISTDSEKKIVSMAGGASHIMDKQYFQFGGLNFEVGYGAKPKKIPFALRCNDFQLDKYPGSSMPSSYASEVTVIDTVNGVEHDQRIFMNHFMDYGGYRFFQSSYFPDESGTILSVNYDYWGSLITYIGYFLMGLGMFISIFNPKGRIAELNNLIKKSRTNRRKMLKTIVLLVGLGISGWSYGQVYSTYSSQKEQKEAAIDRATALDAHSHDHNHAQGAKNHVPPKIVKREVKYLTVDQADELNDLLVQDYDGRIIPFNTLADKLLRKIYRDDHFQGKNAVQTIVAMHLYGSGGWNDVKIISVSHKIRDELGTGKYASIDDLEDETRNFKWLKEYQEAYEKSDAHKNEFDKQLIKLGERYRVVKEIFKFRYFRVIPIPDDDNAKWVWPFSKELLDQDQKVNALTLNLLRSLFLVSQDSIQFSDAEQYLKPLKEYQWKELRAYEAAHPEVRPLTHNHVNIEIMYNKLKIFDKIQSLYFLFGFVLLILFFIRTLVRPTIRSESIIKKISYPFIGAAILVFVVHGIGLGMRWYITGHAPWSDGYEAVVFISWATILAGLFFVRKNPAVIAVTILLAGLMLFVTQLNMLDPEITPLEPVLKSYWLMIHVAVITSSYGFLGVSAVLGLLNMFLYLFKTENNKKRLQMNIVELTSISEMVMIIGLFMLSCGTFLGGVWANESWGRYWGWDPKEVWALVSMLVYAVIIHFRLIPKLSNRFLFNVLSLWGYAAILFTFFGVNFILVGLHSYAQGDGVAEWPTGVIVALVAFSIFTLGIIIKYLLDNKHNKNKEIQEAH